MDSTAEHTHTEIPKLTSDKLAMMKLNGVDGDVFSDPGTPSQNRKSLGFASPLSSSRAMGRSSRSVISRSSSRRSSGFMAAHRSKMSQELTAQAESKFVALMDFMASASREASSLKEFWSRILSERESFAQEREALLEEITEITQELEVRDADYRDNGQEAGERKKQVEKLLVELSTALASVSFERKKVVERDHELSKIRREIEEVRETVTRHRTDYDRVRGELEALQLSFQTVESERDGARDDSDRHYRELQKVIRERTEISSRLTDITTKHETSRKEVLSLHDRIKMHGLETEERVHELERLREDGRKARLRADESAKEVLEVTERHDRVSRDINKFKETIRVVEQERDDHAHTIEHLRREVKTTLAARDDAEEKFSESNLKYEHIKRELLSVKEKLRDVELESTEHHEALERQREHYRVLSIERDELRDEVTTSNRKADDHRRQVMLLTENLRRTETTVSDLRSELHSVTERVKHITIERDDARGKHTLLRTEIAELKEQITAFHAEIRTITGDRDRLRGELEKTRREYEEITETITSFKDDSGELEFEIDSLRTMLREAREQKEQAISARNTADRERDQYISKYEEKCRELERFEESAASHYHSHSRSEGGSTSTSRRVVSRSSTTANSTSQLQSGHQSG